MGINESVVRLSKKEGKVRQSRLTKDEIRQLRKRLSSLRNLVVTLDNTQIEMESSSQKQDILQEMERCRVRLNLEGGVSNE
ncbi:hypothetical protein FACS1894198_5580 [Clostridia bacterium]|nr:hypothetical protein FACS1894198_5580 [Clostridia bacterium]